MPSASPTSAASAIDRAAALLATDPAQAEREARLALQQAPRDPRAALILASALRRRGEIGGALALLAPLAREYPNAALTQYELGLALAANGRPQAAADALRQATRLNRDHAESWRALGDLLFEQGDVEGAEAAFAQHQRALVREPRLKPAAEALCDGRLADAERMLRQMLLVNPNDPLGLQMLAEVALRQGRYADAEVLLARRLELDPSADGARFSYASALFHQQKAAEALPHLERLLAARPDDAAYRNLTAACLGLVGEFDRALTLYEGLLAAYERQPLIWLNYGHALRTVGRTGDAIAAYRRCIALNPALSDAYLGLANLKVARFTETEVAAMRREAERRGLAAETRQQLHFALGKALEDSGDYAASFEHYAAGARLRHAEANYDPGLLSAQVERSKSVFTPQFFTNRADFGALAADPIFIVGLPRSGSTLIEQILASHSAVEGTMELPDLGFIAKELGWSDLSEEAVPYPASLARIDAARAAALGAAYLEVTQVHRKLGRPYFIDKMPNNFQHFGLIHLILPRAKIIDARRHPLGTCFSAFKQHFAQGQSFTYNLADLGRYYRDYVELMQHFDDVLPGRAHRVIYEEMVEDTEGEVRRLLAYCGLPFEAGCLAFYENDRAVRTVSSEQVRRPIFRDGLEQWRNYEPWLGPLKEALGPSLDGWRGR
jgi:tetratricopeptide (TPR) repeat protein